MEDLSNTYRLDLDSLMNFDADASTADNPRTASRATTDDRGQSDQHPRRLQRLRSGVRMRRRHTQNWIANGYRSSRGSGLPVRLWAPKWGSLPTAPAPSMTSPSAQPAVRLPAADELKIGPGSPLFASFEGELSDVDQHYAGKGGFRRVVSERMTSGPWCF